MTFEQMDATLFLINYLSLGRKKTNKKKKLIPDINKNHTKKKKEKSSDF